MMYSDYVKLSIRKPIAKGKKVVCWPARSGLVKSEPECRYAAFTEIN
jgi:hypothetical protein